MGAAPCPKICFLLLFLLFLAAQQPPQLCNTHRPPIASPLQKRASQITTPGSPHLRRAPCPAARELAPNPN